MSSVSHSAESVEKKELEAKELEKKANLADWVVVVHASNPIKEVTLSDLRKYLLKEKNFWSKEFRVVPLILEFDNERFDDFSNLFFNFGKSQYPRYWIEQKFIKGQTRPKEADSKTILKLLSILKGGITVIPKDDWNHIERPSVKSVTLIEND